MQTLDIHNSQYSEFNAFTLFGNNASSDVENSSALLEQLQTTLEIDKLLNIFAMEASKLIDFSGLYFKNETISASIIGSRKGKSERHFELKINNEFIGLLTYTLNRPISVTNFKKLKSLHDKLIFPLRNAVQYQKAMSLALQDSLTRLGNRRYFDEQLKRAMHHANRKRHHIGLIICDLDKFKAINDAHGHKVGDDVLIHFAQALRDSIRDSDSVFRFGGDEFVIIVEEACDQSLNIIESRMNQAVERSAFLAKYQVSCSLGHTYMNRADTELSFFERADQALYQQKMNMPKKLSVV